MHDQRGTEQLVTIPTSQLPAVAGGVLFPGGSGAQPSGSPSHITELRPPRYYQDPGFSPTPKGRVTRLQPDTDPGFCPHPRGPVAWLSGPSRGL